MTFGAAIKYCLSNAFVFRGRGRRSEFWWFYLFLQIVAFVLTMLFFLVWFILAIPLIASADPNTGAISDDDAIGFGIASVVIWGIFFLVALAIDIPLLSANARRLHDIDQSAHWLWFYLIGLGLIPMLMGIAEGTPGPNRFGPDPKAAERAWQPVAPAPYAAPPMPPTYAAPPPQASYPPPPAPPSGGDGDPFLNPPR